MIRLLNFVVDTRLPTVITSERFLQLLSDKESRKQVERERKLFFFRCGDIHPERDGPVFAGCKELYILHNDKNFNFYWLHKGVFPNVEKIYFDGSMAEYRCYNRFSEETWVLQQYAQYFPPEYERKSSEEFIEYLVQAGFFIPMDKVSRRDKLLMDIQEKRKDVPCCWW